jgi:muramoyltetrapeptide carboxypeptidase
VIEPAGFPPAVGVGDRVGVAALSGPVDPERLARGMEGLREVGFKPIPAANLASREGLFAGSDDERLAAFHELAADPSLSAIFFARGGHGLLRVLRGIDWGLLAAHPRAYVGYSDLTPFLLQVVARLGLVAFHGPMVAADFGRGLEASERESLLAALRGEPEGVPLAGVAVDGEAEGPLLGGCLSLLTGTLGTAYAPDLDGALLFWEDVNEPLYKLDRMLTHLRLSGTLAGIAGMVVGTPPAGDGGDPGLWPQVLRDATEGRKPVAWGVPSGHGVPNLTLPLGRRARLDAASGRLLFP